MWTIILIVFDLQGIYICMLKEEYIYIYVYIYKFYIWVYDFCISQPQVTQPYGDINIYIYIYDFVLPFRAPKDLAKFAPQHSHEQHQTSKARGRASTWNLPA